MGYKGWRCTGLEKPNANSLLIAYLNFLILTEQYLRIDALQGEHIEDIITLPSLR
jgi:hypothetical protein